MRKRIPEWGHGELVLLRRYYPWEGVKGVIAALARNNYQPRKRHDIIREANKRGITYGEPEGYVSLRDVHPGNTNANSKSSERILRYAQADGVLKSIGYNAYSKRYVVPQEWAEAYLLEYAKLLEADRECSQWLSIRKAAPLFGVAYQTLSEALANPKRYRTLSKELQDIPIRRGARLTYLEPTATKMAANRYKLRRRKQARPREEHHTPNEGKPDPASSHPAAPSSR